MRLLREEGYECIELGGKSSVDIIAKGREGIFVIILLSNMDSLKVSHAKDAIRLAKLLKGKVIGIGERGRANRLRNGVIYYRHGIPFINLETFRNMLKGESPTITYIKGREVVFLDPEELRKRRERLGLSLQELAKRVGTSKETIYRYERGYPTTEETAQRLESVLGSIPRHPAPLSFREFKDKLTMPFSQLKRLGSEVRQFERLPWSAMARGNVFISFLREKEVSRRKIEQINRMRGKLFSYYLIIGKKKELPYIEEKEIMEAENFSEIEEIARERNE